MSGDNTSTEPTELEILKQQAALMGIQHSNNIGVDALRAKIKAKMDETADNTDDDGKVIETPVAPVVTSTPAPAANPLGDASTGDEPEEPEVPVRKLSLPEFLKNKAMALVRIRISCMDPKKQDLPGEIFTVANEYIGTVKKFVPFGEQTDNGFHVPQCILDLLKERKFLAIQTRTVNGQIETKTRWVKEFNIEELEPLTRAELAKLAADQRATGRLEGED